MPRNFIPKTTPEERAERKRKRLLEQKLFRLQQRRQRRIDEEIVVLTADAVVRATMSGYTPRKIARILGMSADTVRKVKQEAFDRAAMRSYRGGEDHVVKVRARSARVALAAFDAEDPYRTATAVPNLSISSSGSSSFSSVPADPTKIRQFKEDCIRYRKAGLSYQDIAKRTGQQERHVRIVIASILEHARVSEVLHADHHRQMMLDQIDQMIEAIHAQATGRDLDGNDRPVMLEAIDRMMKLLKQKADLLGLNAIPAVDIRVRLQNLAEQSGYDVVDLEEVAREVLTSRKIAGMASLVSSSSDPDPDSEELPDDE